MSISTRIRRLLAACAILLAPATKAQLSFTNANNKIAGPMYSGCAVTVTDVNFDGLDDILRMDQGHNVSLELQNRDGRFSNHYLTSIGSGSAWAMTCADVDHNGWKDMIADGNSGIELVKIFESGGNITSTTTTLQNSGFFLQNATFCDMHNDGWIDLFCCDDNAVSKLYVNDGSGNLFPSTIVDFAVNPGINYATWFKSEAALPSYSVNEVAEGFNANKDILVRTEAIYGDGTKNHAGVHPNLNKAKHKIILTRAESEKIMANAKLVVEGANLQRNEYGSKLFADFFFFITGFHGFHVFSGVIINIIIFINVLLGTYEKRRTYEMVEKVGLYWHFVHLVWVFVFTFFYLV